MRIITGFLWLCNMALYVGTDILAWFIHHWFGLIGLIPVIIFVLAYAFSVEMAIAPRDFWTNSEFDVFRKKMKYANRAAFVPYCVFVGIMFGMLGGG
jgi:hypothetical protein